MDFDISSMMSGGGNVFEKIGQLKIMLPSFAELMKLELREGEDEIMFLGTLEVDQETGKTIPMDRMVAIKEQEFIVDGEKVTKMVVERVVMDKDNNVKEYNLLNFFSMLSGEGTEENTEA